MLCSRVTVEPVKRIKAWLLRWLGGVSVIEHMACEHRHQEEFRYLRTKSADAFTEMDAVFVKLTSEHDAQIAELVRELNTLRNSKQPVTEQKKPIRVIPSWSTFRTAVESQPKPIKIERNA